MHHMTNKSQSESTTRLDIRACLDALNVAHVQGRRRLERGHNHISYTLIEYGKHEGKRKKSAKKSNIAARERGKDN